MKVIEFNSKFNPEVPYIFWIGMKEKGDKYSHSPQLFRTKEFMCFPMSLLACLGTVFDLFAPTTDKQLG